MVKPGQLTAGFSLPELLVVITIIALLTRVIGPRLFRQAGNARVHAASEQLKNLQGALMRYRFETGSYPDTAQGLQVLQTAPSGAAGRTGPYLEGPVPLDPWGHPYVWRNPGRHAEAELVTYGSDGVPGGDGEAADIVRGF